MPLPYYIDLGATLYQGHVLEVLASLPADSVQCVVTSPPYWGLRDYGLPPSEWPEVRFQPLAGLRPVLDESGPVLGSCEVVPAWRGCLGLEPEPMAYVGHLVEVFRRVRRVLKPDGVAWLNLGDSYNGAGANGPQHGAVKRPKRDSPGGVETMATGARKVAGLKPKDLCGIPWRVALALQADGWWLRSEVIWAKFNPMPESVTDRPTKAHEQVFLLAKSEEYHYDAGAIRERAEAGWRGSGFTTGKTAEAKIGQVGQGPRNETEWRNKRTVWNIASQPYEGAHFATMPPELARVPIRAGARPGDVVLDPFSGAGTTGLVALQEGRRFVGCELNPDYCALAVRRWEESAAQTVMFAVGEDR